MLGELIEGEDCSGINYFIAEQGRASVLIARLVKDKGCGHGAIVKSARKICRGGRVCFV